MNQKIFLKEGGFRITYCPGVFATGIYGNRKKQFSRKKKKKGKKTRL